MIFRNERVHNAYFLHVCVYMQCGPIGIFCIILHNFFVFSLFYTLFPFLHLSFLFSLLKKEYRKKIHSERYIIRAFIEIQINFCQLVKSHEAYCLFDLFFTSTYLQFQFKDTINLYESTNDTEFSIIFSFFHSLS